MNRCTPRSFLLGLTLAVVAAGNTPVWATSATSPLPISEVPLILPSVSHPEVLFAFGNSESLDGTLSGAILTGSGAVPGGLSSLTISSSQVNYVVPSDFVPPVTGGASGSAQPNTVTSGGVETDNSASRLNVAKQAIQATIAAYASNTQFALEDYNAATGSTYDTWLYVMSGSPGFTFSTTSTPVPAGQEAIDNPCFGYLTASATVQSNCASIVSAGLYSSATLNGNKYMFVAQSSDDPAVNDVLYSSPGLQAIFDTYGGPSPLNPYTGFTLSQYNHGNIFVQYTTSAPNEGAFGTSPTNAGFVPFSPQVMYEQRGFGYNSNASPTTGNIVVGAAGMITAGTSPTAASIAAVNAAFAAPLAPETNNASSSEIKAVAVQAPTAGLMAGALTYLSGLPAGTCNPQKYVVLISDGLPTEDLNGLSWPPLGSAAATGYGVSATFNANGTVNTTNDQALTDTITKISALNAAGIKVYIVGMGGGVNPAFNPVAASTLTAMAIAGGTTNYFPAVSTSALVSDLNVILASIQNASLQSGSLPVEGARLTANSLSYVPSFSVNGTDWTGDVFANAFNADGTPVTNPVTGALVKTWDAATLLASTTPSSRDIVTVTTPTAGSSGTGLATSLFLEPSLQTALGTPAAVMAFLGYPPLSSTQYNSLGTPTVIATDIINYLRGDQSNIQPAGPFRSRSSILGDIVNSVPHVSSTNDDFGYSLQPGVLGTSYSTFVAQKIASGTPATMIYVGANDGMMHAFNGTSGTGGGQEEFAFVPNSIASNLGLLVNPVYTHQYFDDGQINVIDANLGTTTVPNWRSVLLGTPGAGGAGLYALDVTAPASFGPGNVLWEINSNSGNGYVGYDLGQAQIIIGEDSAFYAVVGNGYNSPNGKPALLVINIATGKIVNTIVATDPDATPIAGNGIGQIAGVNALGNNGLVDTIYGGDLDGNVWKFDLSSGPQTGVVGNAGNPLFVAMDALGNRQPITSNFEIASGPLGGLMIYFGTGKFFLVGDNIVPATPQIQTLYGIWDNFTNGVSLLRSDLVQQTISGQTNGAITTRTTSSNPVTYTGTGDPRGFYLDLKVTTASSGDGEFFIGQPVVQNGIIFFTSFEPTSASCTPGGNRWLYGLSSLTGANALSQIVQAGGSAACAAGGCGAIQVGTGAPDPQPSLVIPGPSCTPGAFGCTGTTIPPPLCDWNGQNPSCCTGPACKNAPPPPPSKCTIVIGVPGQPSLVLPRSCNRQSWRQVR